MPSWKWRGVRKALTKKGFELTRSTNHEYYCLYYKGKATSIRTKISHGNKSELHSNRPLYGALQQQLRLQSKQLENFLNCPLTAEEYITILKAGGYIKV